MKIRAYRIGEEHEIWQLFYQTIHHVNAKDYSQDQLDAWAPKLAKIADQTSWSQKLSKLNSFVCVDQQKIVGYSDLQDNGYIDHFFCHHLHQGQGIGSLLMAHIHGLAHKKSIQQLSADVSLTAKPFFQAKGFSVNTQQTATIRGVTLTNFKMLKTLK